MKGPSKRIRLGWHFTIYLIAAWCSVPVGIALGLITHWWHALFSVVGLLIGTAAHADSLTPLGLLNFLVLQWFGVRIFLGREVLGRDGKNTVLGRYSCAGVCRWVVPLTGWWSDFRWFGTKRPVKFFFRRRR